MRAPSSSRFDALLAVALTVAGELELLLGPAHGGSRLVSALVLPLTTLPLAWRRAAPLVPAVAVAVALAAQALLDGILVGYVVVPVLAFALAFYAAGRYLAGGWALGAAALAAAVVAATRVASDPAAGRPAEIALTVLAVASPLLVGRWVRGQRLLQRELEDKAERLLRERERAARHAAEDERARIAADLQAAVAGGLRAIAAQAEELPARLQAADHAAARVLLASIAATAREALADVRRVLGVLRREGQPAPLAPPVADPFAGAGAVATPRPPVPRGDGRARRRRPALAGPLADRLLVVAVWAGAELELALTAHGRPAVAAAGAVAIAVPLLWRRSHPIAVALAVLGAVALQSSLLDLDRFPIFDIVAVICAAYATGTYAARRQAIAGLALLAAIAAAHAAVFYPDGVAPALLGGVVLPWTVGRVVHGQRRLTQEGHEKAEQIDRSRAEEARAAVTSERMRVARELHDAVAHNISVIAIQAGGADGIVERDPERAARCAALIATVAREALAELGRLAGFAGDGGHAPPSLARVDALARRARAAGLPVELRVEGDRAALPAGVDLAAYRIVQEALANACKHAAAGRAWVVVRYEERAVRVEIADDGCGPGTPGGRRGRAPGGGHGLVGMRERVALYDGTLDVGRRPAGGFAVRARLPWGRA